MLSIEAKKLNIETLVSNILPITNIWLEEALKPIAIYVSNITEKIPDLTLLYQDWCNS